jgi:hypothetical protein
MRNQSLQGNKTQNHQSEARLTYRRNSLRKQLLQGWAQTKDLEPTSKSNQRSKTWL